MKTRVVPKIGDIIEIKTPKGLRYVQYTMKHSTPPVFGELVRVLPGLYKKRPSEFSALAQRRESYFIFTPIGLTCRRKRATIVSNEEVPAWARGMPLMRMSNRFDEDGKRHDWHLWDGERTWPATGTSAELSNLSIASIWGHDILVDKLAEEWLPANEPVQPEPGGVPESRSSVASGTEGGIEEDREEFHLLESDPSGRSEVRHYLYFPSELSAKNAGETLGANGYSVIVQRSDDQTSWLVAATAHVQLDKETMEEATASMERLAALNQGEYDGWHVMVAEV